MKHTCKHMAQGEGVLASFGEGKGGPRQPAGWLDDRYVGLG
jgi:hypothetical protein